MSEQNLRARVRDLLKPGFILQVENMVGAGTPDTHYCIAGMAGWIELKYARRVPARESTAVFKSVNRGLDVEQEAWLYKYDREGGSAHVLAQVGASLYLVEGILSYSFNEFTLDELQEYRVDPKKLRASLVSYGAARKAGSRGPYTA